MSFDITSKELEIWDKYFTSMNSDNSVVKMFDSNVSDLFQNFNIQQQSKGKKRRFSIKSNTPQESDQTLNNFISQMNISNSYFEICKYLFKLYNDSKEKYDQIAEQSIPHIFRSFIIIIHILKIKIQNIIHEKGEESDSLYNSIVDSLPYYIDFFLKQKNDTFEDGLYLTDLLFHKLSHFFPQICKNITSVYFNSIPNLIKNIFCCMTLNQLSTSSSLSPFIEFISGFYHYSFLIDFNDNKERNDCLITYLSILIKYCSNLKSISNSAYWSLTSFLLSYLDMLSLYDTINHFQEFFSLSMEILKFLYPFRSEEKDDTAIENFQCINDNNFAKILSRFLISFIHNNQLKKEDVQIKQTKKDQISSSYLHDIDIFEKFDVNYLNCSSEIFNYSTINHENFLPEHAMNMICNQTSYFFKVNLDLFSIFTNCFLNAKKDGDFLCHIALYCSLIKSILKNDSPEIISKLAQVLEDNKIWSLLLSTETIFDESFVVNELNCLYNETQILIFDVVQIFLFSQIKESKKSIVNSLENLINEHSPQICSGIINYLRSYIQISKEIISINSGLIKTVIKNDRYMKNILYYKRDISENEKELYIKSHFDTFLLISEIFDLDLSFDYDSNSVSYLYSYLFETDESIRLKIIGILTNAFDKCKTTHYFIGTLTSIIEQRMSSIEENQSDKFTFENFSNIIHMFILSTQKNPKDTIKNILSSNSIQSISNIPEYLIISYSNSNSLDDISSDFEFNEESQKDILIIIQYIIQLYTLICKLNKSTFKLLNTSQSQEIISYSKKISQYIKIDQSTYDYFISFLCSKKIYDSKGMENYRIVNFGAINFIYDWTYETPFFDTFLDNLISLSENSLSNCYQLFKCQTKSRLLQYILENSKNCNPKAYELYYSISKSFFNIIDVKEILHAIIQSEKECSTKLLEIFSTILNKDYSKLPNSFFHISGEFDNKLVISKLPIHNPISISTKVLFEKNTPKSTFMEILDESTQISIMVNNDETIHIETTIASENPNESFSYKSNHWYKLKVNLTNEMIEIYLNKQLKLKYVFQTHVEFNNNIKIQFIGEKCNIDDIAIRDSRSNKKIANFTAKLLHNKSNKVFNTIESQVKARFNGIYAPYSPRLIESIVSCGGPKIILPLFTVVSKASNQLEYLRLILVSIHTFMRKNEESFLKINFFRIFNHLLSSIKLNDIQFPLSCSNEIIGIFKSIQNDELKEEMSIYFWSDFALCAKFENFIPFFYVENFDSLKNSLTMQRCTSSVDHVDSPAYIDTLVGLLIFLFDKTSIDDETAKFLLTVIKMKSVGETCGIIFLQVISHYIQLKNNSVMTALKDTNFNSLIELSNSSNSIELTLWIIRTFLIICHTIPESKNDLYDFLMKFNFFNNDIEISTEKVDQLFEVITVFFFDSENSIYQIPFDSIKLKKDGVKGIRYPQFIPLICNLFKFLNGKKIIEFLNLFYNSIFNDVVLYSQLIYQYLPNWIIFIFFLMQNDEENQYRRWNQIIAFILKLNLNQVPQFISLCYIFCSLNQLCFTDLLFEIVELLLMSRNSSTETDIISQLPKQTIFLIFKLLVFQPIIKSNERTNEIKNNFNLFNKQINEFQVDSIELNLDVYKSLNISNERLSKISNLSLLLMNYISNNSDSKLISFGNKSSVTIGYFIVILLSKLMPTNPKVYFEIIKKILTNSDTNNTFIRIIHLSIVHYFHDNKEYGNDIIQIVKDENPEFKTATKEIILMTAELMLEGFTDSMNKYTQSFPSEFEEMVKSFDFIINSKEKAVISDSENEEQLFLYYLKTKKYNTKLWTDLYDGMKLEASNVWSVPNISKHKKYCNRYDSIGRHLFTARNKDFNDHSDASSSRDEGKNVTVEASFIDYKPIETNTKSILSILKIDCRMLTIDSLYIGTLYIEKRSKSIIFESKFGCDPILDNQKEIQKVVTIELSTVKYILWRRYHHIDNSIEFLGTKSYFFTFENNIERSQLLNELEKVKFMFPNIVYIQNKPSIEAFQSLHFTEQWKNGDMTNYEYLFWVNMFAGRSYCDISQYPVFPWIIQNFTSPHLDLNDPNNFRDLALPIGAMNEQRLEKLKELKSEVIGTENYCLYRFHYSTASYIIYYMIRCEPFTTMHIHLQKNRFDNPRRLFRSIQKTWESVVSTNMDFKELIPEFFTFSEFLLNSEKFDLGYIDESDERVNDVKLPKWANSASQFIAMHRLALESPLCSEKIDHWIDLVFGYKQRGIESENALNDFHKFSYSTTVDELLSSENKDEEELAKIQYFAANFGITPEQLFNEKHPQRTNFISLSKGIQIATSSDIKIKTTPFPILNGLDIVKISIEDDQIFTIDSSCRLSKFKKSKDKWSLIETSLSFTNYELNELISDYLAIIPSSHLILITTPWADKFSLFKIKSKIPFVGNSIKSVFTSPRHNSCISVARADMNFIAIGTQNADVKLWDIKKSIYYNENNSNDNDKDINAENGNSNTNLDNADNIKKYYQNSKLLIGHSSPIIDISINESMDTIISIDESQLLICFSISTGKQIFSIQLTQNAKRIFLSKLGFIIVLSEFDHKNNSAVISRRSSSVSINNDEYSLNSQQHIEMENVTSISLYDLNGNLIEMSDFSGIISCAELIETIDCSEFLACSFENSNFMLLRVYDLFEVLKIKTNSKICLMSFFKKEMYFLFRLANNNVIKAELSVN